MAIGLPPGTRGTAGAAQVGLEAVVGANAEAPAGTKKGKPSLSSAVAASAAEAMVQRYTIIDGFLLDTCTGKVWKYDDASNSFVAVPRKLTQLEFLGAQLRAERALDQFKARHADEVLVNLPGSIRNEVSKKFESDYVKVIEDAVNKMRPKA